MSLPSSPPLPSPPPLHPVPRSLLHTGHVEELNSVKYDWLWRVRSLVAVEPKSLTATHEPTFKELAWLLAIAPTSPKKSHVSVATFLDAWKARSDELWAVVKWWPGSSKSVVNAVQAVLRKLLPQFGKAKEGLARAR
jgi:hypothetical protein